MICPYCKIKVSGKGWGAHSKACAERKYVRTGEIPKHRAALPPFSDTVKTGEAIGEPRTTEDQAPARAIPLDEMSKKELIDYFTRCDIPHDPKASKSKLLKLAKGE